jgi:nucleotide-binding universal stress UspA family protein
MAGELIAGVGGDGSGFQAARTAARVADLMHVPLVLVFGFESVAMGPRGGALETEIEAIGDEAVADIRDDIRATYPDLDVQVEMVPQRPVDALLHVADVRGAAAIAVGHGGSGPLKGALLGSITYEIVHRSHIAVLVVPDEPSDLED